MSKRKKYIIDKSFQLKAAFSIIGIVSLIALIILSAIAVSVVYNNEKINNVYTIEDSIFQMMQAANINENVDDGYKSTIDNLTNLHNNNYTTILKIAKYNRYLLGILVITIIIQGFVLFFMIIKITHRISGPIYVISNYFKDVIAGKIPKTRPLRDKDELKEFYKLSIDLVDSLKKDGK
jgi:signal transduction histidine kinase